MPKEKRKVLISENEEVDLLKFLVSGCTLEDFKSQKARECEKYKNLYKLSLDDMATILYGSGYEVVLYKVVPKEGIWVSKNFSGKRCTGIVRGVDLSSEFVQVDWYNAREFNMSVTNTIFLDNELDYATKEEIEHAKKVRWWESHGKDVWQLEKHDIITDGLTFYEVVVVVDGGAVVDGGVIVNDSAKDDINRRRPILHHNLEESYRVVCFAKDRYYKGGPQ